MKRAFIMAGGTGGHVIPGLTIAEELKSKEFEIFWLGTKKGIEAKLVPGAGIPIYYLPVKGLRGKRLLSLLTAPFILFFALIQAIRIILKLKPDVVIGLGGYASGPGGLAAWLLRKPLIIHEQNSVAGMTNRILSRFAKATLEAFPKSFPAKRAAIWVGNPIRETIRKLPGPTIRFQEVNRLKHRLRVLVIGGSLGAKAINEMLPRALRQLPPDRIPHVWHQVGPKHLESTAILYEQCDIQVKLSPFIEDMAKAYEWADLVICRAGAITVSELAAVGVASILIPYPHAVDDHQTKNAQYLTGKNAGILLRQEDLTAETLANILNDFSLHPNKCLEMAEAARRLAVMDSTEKVVFHCDISVIASEAKQSRS